MDGVAVFGGVTALITTLGNIFLFYQGNKTIDKGIDGFRAQGNAELRRLEMLDDRFAKAQEQMDRLIDELAGLRTLDGRVAKLEEKMEP